MIIFCAVPVSDFSLTLNGMTIERVFLMTTSKESFITLRGVF